MDTLVRTPKIVYEKFREYFFPTVLISLANNLAVIVDSIMVGNILGSNEMAAIQLLSPINQLYFALTVLFGLGASTLMSVAVAQGKKQKANSIFTVAFIAVTVITVLLIGSQFLFLEQIIDSLTPLRNMEDLIRAYYIPFIIGTPFQMYLCSFVYCIRSDGRPKFASNLIIISNVINLVMDYVLMAIFQLGIAGSSIATVIGNIVSFILMLSQFWYKENTLKFDFGICTRVKEFFKELSSLLSTGLAGAFATLLVTIRVFFLNEMVQIHGSNDGIVAMSVASMGLILVSSIVTGACQTMAPLASTFYAQHDNKSVGYAFKRAALYMIVVILIIVVLMEFFPSAFAEAFGRKTASELAETNLALRITALSYPGMGLSFLFLYYFTSIQRNTMSLIVSFANGLSSVPVAYIFSNFMGLNGVWIGILVSQYLTLLLAIGMPVFEKMKSKEKYENFLLLEPNESEILNFTITTDYPADELEEALRKQSKLEKKAKKIATALSHFKATNVAPNNIDVRINENEENLIINCRINEDGYRLDMIERLAIKSLEDDKVLGMYEIKITI